MSITLAISTLSRSSGMADTDATPKRGPIAEYRSVDIDCERDATQSLLDFETARSRSPDSVMSSDEEEAWSIEGPEDNSDIIPDAKSIFSAVLSHQGYLEQLLEHVDCLGSPSCECEFCFIERGGLV
ncbi:hypothetical protein FA13DRAFT_1773337 [Coprinellus micaceus]|uniref:Uncharacterized protein n=1 Tax=Coprinellus micaceus TaxID=71717 RepID=A0A4Y7TG07_COPMI|nr:hypothetical protein FA13DRAFT_1773337 [Coprinellus micaceus]